MVKLGHLVSYSRNVKLRLHDGKPALHSALHESRSLDRYMVSRGWFQGVREVSSIRVRHDERAGKVNNKTDK